MSRDPKDLTDLLQKVWNDIQAWYKVAYPNYELFLTCTYRSPEEQADLYASGRTRPGSILTQCDGVKKLSKHNSKPSRAFDLGIKEHGRVTWAVKYFTPIGKAIESSKYSNSVRWGGDFSFKDFPHIEEI